MVTLFSLIGGHQRCFTTASVTKKLYYHTSLQVDNRGLDRERARTSREWNISTEKTP
jgi:hypothetical protein